MGDIACPIWKTPIKKNAKERVEQNGYIAELLRQIYLDRLKAYNAAFYEHGKFEDLVGLCSAHELLEKHNAASSAPHGVGLLECICALFDGRALGSAVGNVGVEQLHKPPGLSKRHSGSQVRLQQSGSI